MSSLFTKWGVFSCFQLKMYTYISIYVNSLNRYFQIFFKPQRLLRIWMSPKTCQSSYKQVFINNYDMTKSIFRFPLVLKKRKTKKIRINSKVLIYSTGNHIQCPMINHNGKEYENEYICITESLCCTAVINTTLWFNY